MKKIYTKKGTEILIDDSDYEWLSQYKWYDKTAKHGIYPHTYFDKRNHYIGRLIMGLKHGDERCVDHIDGNPLNNCRSNLRICTRAQNNANRHRSNNRTGYKGVSKKINHYEVFIGDDRQYVGSFNSPEKAALAYNRAAVQRYGEFAFINKI
jgi:hypothetical protein